MNYTKLENKAGSAWIKKQKTVKYISLISLDQKKNFLVRKSDIFFLHSSKANFFFLCRNKVRLAFKGTSVVHFKSEGHLVNNDINMSILLNKTIQLPFLSFNLWRLPVKSSKEELNAYSF